MKAAFIEKPGEIAVRDVPQPDAGDHELLIEVKASGICGTDIHIFRGEYLGTYPVIPGHEFSGVVTAVGARVTRLSPGTALPWSRTSPATIVPPACRTDRISARTGRLSA